MSASGSRRKRLALGFGITQTLAWASTFYLPAVLGPAMARDLGVSQPHVFGAFSAALIVSALLGPFAGRAIDRGAARSVLTASSAIIAVGLLTLSMSQSYSVLFLGWLCVGVGMSLGLYDAVFAALTALFGTSARGLITGVTLLGGFASTVGWPLSAWLDAELGWRGACVSWAAIQLFICMPLHFFMLREAGKIPGEKVKEPNLPLTSTDHRAMALLALTFSAVWFVVGAMAAHLPQVLKLAGASSTEAIAAGALLGPAQVLARLAEFGFLRRFHPLISARIASIAHPLGASFLIIFGSPVAYLFTVLHGAGTGIFTVARGTLPLSLFGPAGYGLKTGIIGVAPRFVQATAPFLFGLLLESYGAFSLLFSIGLNLIALVALCCIRGDRTRLEEKTN